MRRLLLVNALIFAVLAASVALAYYGYSYASGVASRERELELMRELAEEKVLNIESLVANDDAKLFREIQFDNLARLRDLVKDSGAAVSRSAARSTQPSTVSMNGTETIRLSGSSENGMP